MSNEGAIGGGGISSTVFTTGKNSKLVAVRVLDIILDISHPKAEELGFYDSIGTIFFSKLDEDTSSGIDGARKARPLFTFIKNYPLKGEIVFIFTSAGRQRDRVTFYLPAANMWNHPHHNALPSIADLEQLGTKQDYVTSANGVSYRRIEDGSSGINLGNTFSERLNIKPLIAYEGDSILEGRFGNSIRLGSTVIGSGIVNPWSTDNPESISGDPIMILRNGQHPTDDGQSWVPTLENISKDLSSIYLTSTQKLKGLQVASPYQNSYAGKVLKPIPDLITSIPVDPDPPEEEIETEIVVDDPVIVTEEEQEIISSYEAPPPPTPIPFPTNDVTSPTDADELSPFDELLEEGIYDDEFEEEQNDSIGGDDEGDSWVVDNTSEIDSVTPGDIQIGEENAGNDQQNNENNDTVVIEGSEVSAPGGGSYVLQPALNNWIRDGLVPAGCNDEAEPTGYPCIVTSVRKKWGFYPQWKIEKRYDATAMASQILANPVKNSKLKYICFHTSAFRNGDAKQILYYFCRKKSWEDDGKKYKAWTRPGYQIMIDTDGKCSYVLPTGNAHDSMINNYNSEASTILGRPNGGKSIIGDDTVGFCGQGDGGKFYNSNTFSITWLPANTYVDGTPLKKYENRKGEKEWPHGGADLEKNGLGPAGMTVAQAHAYKILIYAYAQKYPDIKFVGHNNKSSKDCPGFNGPELVKLMHESGEYPLINETQYSYDRFASSKYKGDPYVENSKKVFNNFKDEIAV